MMNYSDNKKREYMRMFFDGQDKTFCKNAIDCLKLDDNSRFLLLSRYYHKQSDKEIALETGFSHDYINKQISKSLVQSYNALKHIEYKAFSTPKEQLTL